MRKDRDMHFFWKLPKRSGLCLVNEVWPRMECHRRISRLHVVSELSAKTVLYSVPEATFCVMELIVTIARSPCHAKECGTRCLYHLSLNPGLIR